MYIGLTPQQFDELTPRELLMMYKAFRRRQEGDERCRQVLAYDTAVCVVSFFGAALAGKSIPEFDVMFSSRHRISTSGGTMSNEQLASAIIALNRQLGGTEDFGTGGDDNGRN